MLVKTILTFAFSAAVIGCGIDLMESNKSETTEPEEPGMVAIPLEVVDKTALSLTSASAFSMDLTGCASGYTFTATEANASVNVYKYDRGCLLKLKSLTVGGVVYNSSNPGAADFTNWEMEDIAIFTSDGGSSIAIGVVSQLGDPISGTEAVSYTFAMVTSGSDETIADTDVGDGHAISVDGHPAPPVTISSVAFSDIASSGAGQFSFNLECVSTISGDNCDGIDMTEWEYALVDDTYSSSPTALDLVELSYIDGGATVDSSIGSFGGVISPSMYGPEEIHNNPNMILIIRNEISYKFFNVDVTVVSNSN
jgi:hypothetical protein